MLWKRLGIALLVVIVLLFLRDALLEAAAERVSSQILGTPVKIGRLSLSLMRHQLEVRDFQVVHPQGFPKGILLSIPRVKADYDAGALWRKKLVLNSLEVEMKKVVIVKNADGRLNVDALKVARQKPDQEKKPAQKTEFRANVLKLKIGKIIYKDYSLGPKPVIEMIDLDMKEATYNGIASAGELFALVLTESLKHTAIQGAMIYGVASAAGTSFLPAGLAVMAAQKPDVAEAVKGSPKKAFRAGMEAAKALGEIKEVDEKAGVIKAEIQGGEATIFIEKTSPVRVRVSAKKMFMPAPKIAAGLLYEITDRLE
ncbi:MAG: hypothetical protein HY592_03455 [Candidatus Omnitrophica bacterium]|nr:hypothetical protein [Candidatus Omnitrophota bacterium]